MTRSMTDWLSMQHWLQWLVYIYRPRIKPHKELCDSTRALYPRVTSSKYNVTRGLSHGTLFCKTLYLWYTTPVAWPRFSSWEWEVGVWEGCFLLTGGGRGLRKFFFSNFSYWTTTANVCWGTCNSGANGVLLFAIGIYHWWWGSGRLATRKFILNFMHFLAIPMPVGPNTNSWRRRTARVPVVAY